MLDYHMNKAYDLIHKDKILAYSLDAYRVPDDEYEKISQDFVKLVRKLISKLRPSAIFFIVCCVGSFVNHKC